MSKPISGYYDATKYLGQFIGEQEEFLKDTACMSPEMRITFAVLQSAKEIFKDDAEILQLITDAEPLLRRLGFAQWQRDTVTDMAIKKANPQVTETFDDEDANTAKDGGSSKEPIQ